MFTVIGDQCTVSYACEHFVDEELADLYAKFLSIQMDCEVLVEKDLFEDVNPMRTKKDVRAEIADAIEILSEATRKKLVDLIDKLDKLK